MVVIKVNVLDNAATIIFLLQSHKCLASSLFGWLVTLPFFIVNAIAMFTFSHASKITSALVAMPFSDPKL
jgi:hypothetical protein